MLRNSEPTAFAKIVLHIYVPSVDLRKTSIKGMFLVQLYCAHYCKATLTLSDLKNSPIFSLGRKWREPNAQCDLGFDVVM